MHTSVFTDGSSRGNPGPGGWGAIVATPDEVIELGGRAEHSTNNRMELTAAIGALSYLDQQSRVKGQQFTVYTDSKYVSEGITKWVSGWQENGWKTANKKEVLNRDLWEALYALVQDKNISWKYVAGHMGHPGNERCDIIATTFADGEKIELYRGVRGSYLISLDVDVNERVSKKFWYVSVIGGVFARDESWSACEKRVKGVAGAKFKKVKNTKDEQAALQNWGVV